MAALGRSVMRTVSDDRNGNLNLRIGDQVDVPGGMYGVIRFIGEVRGKNGIFAGVELGEEWAARGKNDGDVDGVQYFRTSIPGSGIFLPSSKAYKRVLSEADQSLGSLASVSKYSQSMGPGRSISPTMKSKRPSLPRPESPLRRQQAAASTPQPRPSLAGKASLSKSMIGGAPRGAPSPTPSKFSSSVRGTKAGPVVARKAPLAGTPKPATRRTTGAQTPSRSASRAASRLGPELMFDDDGGEDTPIGVARSVHAAIRPATASSKRPSGVGDELHILRTQLEERDRQLEKYAADLEEMQNSIAELQNGSPKVSSTRASGIDDHDAASLRAIVREKNEKIAALTQEFDTHRADFRDTIDILEHTSDETNRHYESRIEQLETELRAQSSREDDVESVAQQLIQLEKHVEELEEGLEDSRRGESEARAEVEHLRGEVERGKAELRRERERCSKAAADTFQNSTWKREIANRDNEINGLKAIIHSLSRDAPSRPVSDSPRNSRRDRLDDSNGASEESRGNRASLDAQLESERKAREQLEREVKNLEGIVDRKTYREEELEHEIQRLQKHNSNGTFGGQSGTAPVQRSSGLSSSTYSNNYTGRHLSNQSSNRQQVNSFQAAQSTTRSQRSHLSGITTAHNVASAASPSQGHRSGGISDPVPDDTDSGTDHEAEADANGTVWCELCESTAHNILVCPMLNATNPTDVDGAKQGQSPIISAVNEPEPNSAHKTPRPTSATTASQQASPIETRTLPSPRRTGSTEREEPPRKNVSNPHSNEMVPGKDSGIIDPSKWCALCEKDGHESVDCPFDNEF